MTSLRPHVSVIIPNFNYAKYLDQRILSVLDQTFQNLEIILLDDASTDKSVDVISRFASDPRVTTRFNKKNSGSVFKQWNLGVQMARGEYIWIAEADDLAEPKLLESLVRVLDANKSVGLAYCQSWKIDGDGQILGTMRFAERWDRDFINNGREECRELLGTNFLTWGNTIPNASAVVFRRDVFQRTGGAPEWLRLNGDWYFYLQILSVSDVAFIAEPLNYYRQHDGTVRKASVSNGTNLKEVYEVLRLSRRKDLLDRETFKERLRQLQMAWLGPREFQRLGLRNACWIFATAVTFDFRVIVPFCLQVARTIQLRLMAGLRTVLRRGLGPVGYRYLRKAVKGRQLETEIVQDSK